MNKADSKANKRLAPMISYSSIVIGAWVFICVSLTVMDEVKNNQASFSAQAFIFKEECVSAQGKVRHESSILIPELYCMEKDGNEALFFHERLRPNLVVLAADQIFFGIFDLESMLE